jgi:Kef-type K+ transport system membrane component KefB/voltage-gated potassium channel Kch
MLTGTVLSGVSYFFFDVSMREAILIGPALALSSTAFVLQLLCEQKLLTSKFGKTSLAVLLLQDLAVVPLLILVPLLAMPELSIGADIGLALAESLLILGMVVLIGRYFLHPLLHRVALSGNPEVFTASAVLIVLGTAFVTEHAGLSMAMGAFLAGLLISDSFYRHQVLAEIQPFRGLLLGLFFMSMGMSLDLGLLFENPVNSLGLLVTLIIIKISVLFPVTLWYGNSKQNALAVSLMLAQSGEFALVLFSLAAQSSILSEALFQQLLLIVLLSMLVTPVLANFAQSILDRQYTMNGIDSELPVEAPIVLVGFGRVGHRIGEILFQAGIPFVALDFDALVVEKAHAKGYPVYYGDVRKPELIEAAGTNNARIIILTLNDPEASEQLVTSLHKSHPEVDIYVRGHSLVECRTLRKLGASGAVSENVEASLELASMVLTKTGFDDKKRESIIRNFRRAYHSQIDN